MRKISINKQRAGYKACYYILVLARVVSSIQVSHLSPVVIEDLNFLKKSETDE